MVTEGSNGCVVAKYHPFRRDSCQHPSAHAILTYLRTYFLGEVEQQLKVELLMCKRGTSSITDYLNRFKAICELLAAMERRRRTDFIFATGAKVSK